MCECTVLYVMCVCMLNSCRFYTSHVSRGEGVNCGHGSFLQSAHTRTHTRPVGVEENDWRVPWPGPSPTLATPNTPLQHTETHLEKSFSEETDLFFLPLLSFEKSALVIKPRFHTCSYLSTCVRQLVISTNAPQLLKHLDTEEEEAILAESSGCFAHVWTLRHP